MLKNLSQVLCLQDPRKKASLALARVLTQYDMESLSFRGDVVSTRRQGEARQIALGAWLIPYCSEGPRGVLDFDAAIPAVTYDLRRNGIGVLTQQEIQLTTVTVAMPDRDGIWRFFESHICHQSRRPGGWFLQGMQVQQLLEPHPGDVTHFRIHIRDLDPADKEAVLLTETEPAETSIQSLFEQYFGVGAAKL